MNTTTPSPATPSDALLPEDFDAIEDILDDIRTRSDETPQWEFCEGFLAALVCSRRAIPMPEVLSVLFDIGEDGEGLFADAAQMEAFTKLWDRRFAEVRTALDAPVENLEDKRAYMPEVVDVRGMMADLSPEERAEAMQDQSGPLPAFAQVWALGFMYAVESWLEEWTAPTKDKEAAKVLNDALDAIVALSEDDTDPPEISPYEIDAADEGLPAPAPSMSFNRMEVFGEALWAVYDLREMWRAIGPRVETVRVQPTPGRNDPCPCGSGKKYKKCHGA